MTALTPTAAALSDVRRYQRQRAIQMPPLCLSLGLSAIREGLAAIDRGQNEAGYRLIQHGADYLQPFLPKMDSRLAAEVGIAAENMRRRATS